ncbi:MAG: hypothetical protein ACK5M4_03155 [Pseudorhodobacter sp.]
MRFLFPLIFVVAAICGLKGAIHYHVGGDLYAERISAMQAGQGLDRLGAMIMTPDPVTRWISGALHFYLDGKEQILLPGGKFL